MTFGLFDVRLDGWDIGYGAEFQADFEGALDERDVLDLDVERPAHAWMPVAPATVAAPRTLVFIDGVRRLDARLVVRSGDITCYGAFGSYAVGAVIAEPGRKARVGEPIIVRHLIYGSGQLPEAPVHVGKALDYLPLSTPDVEPDGPLTALQIAMRRAEAELAVSGAFEIDRVSGAPSAGAPVVVCDGPLQEASASSLAPAQDVVGLIKRVYKLYLPITLRGVLGRLQPGERTPVFRIGTEDPRSRLAWFLRLAAPGRAESELSGLVRLEVDAARGVRYACQLADEMATRLPAFAPSRARDPRAPQNLLPIGALEQHLRHRLGDPRLIHRKIAEAIA